MNLKTGDLVEVLDVGLSTLRRLCPDMPPNHHGRVAEVKEDGTILVEFPIDGGYEHSQVAPYPAATVKRRQSSE